MTQVILRPNGAGLYTQWDSQYPSGGDHWDKVDEVIQDGDATVVLDATYGYKDLYTILNTIPSGSIINSIRIYSWVNIGIETCDTKFGIYDGTGEWWSDTIPILVYDVYTLIDSGLLTTNPRTSLDWTWSEINNLQIGLQALPSEYGSLKNTQIYVEVDYTAPLGGGYVC